MGILDYVDKDVEKVYYIMAWDENNNLYDNMYDDLIFEDEEEALDMCLELNKDSEGLEYEVYDAKMVRKCK